MQKPKFVNNEVYHVYNRGVEKRNIFTHNSDYLRFIHDLFEFNDNQSAQPSNIKFSLREPSLLEEARLFQCLEAGPLNIGRKRKLLVEILAFCLMPNHFHLLLRQKVENGIIKFMQKLGTGYAVYFNQKKERVGPLFQGRFKAVLVKNDRHLMYLPHYIHLNPLDMVMPDWRKGKIKNSAKAIEFLENYRWSSFPDYTGDKNFPSITQRKFILGLFGGVKEYYNSAKDWLSEMNFEEIQDFTLE